MFEYMLTGLEKMYKFAKIGAKIGNFLLDLTRMLSHTVPRSSVSCGHGRWCTISLYMVEKCEPNNGRGIHFFCLSLIHI